MTQDVLYSIFQITLDNREATSFQYNKGGKIFLVTAKHLFCENDSFTELRYQNGSEVKFQCTDNSGLHWIKKQVYFHSNPNIDIAVIDLKQEGTAGMSYKIEDEITYGEQIFFLGFPLGRSVFSHDLNRGFPFPYIKSAIISCWDKNDFWGFRLFLDGMNIEGFSGGPVVKYQKVNDVTITQLVGIISGYVPQEGVTEKGDKFKVNSGIVVSYQAVHIDEIIEQNKVQILSSIGTSA